MFNALRDLIYRISRKVGYAIATLLLGIFLVLPLGIFAVFTFFAAIGVLALLVLSKGISASWGKFSRWWYDEPQDSLERLAQRQRTLATLKRKSRYEPGAQGSGSSNTTTRSHSNRSNSNISLASLPQPNRDYEGLGGWLITDSNAELNNPNSDLNDNQAIYFNLRRGSQQPDGSPPQFRRRSFGAASSGINSPEMVRTPSLRSSNNVSGSYHERQRSGTVSPQSYFNVAAGRSTTSFNSRRNSRVISKETVRVSTDSESDANWNEHAIT